MLICAATATSQITAFEDTDRRLGVRSARPFRRLTCHVMVPSAGALLTGVLVSAGAVAGLVLGCSG